MTFRKIEPSDVFRARDRVVDIVIPDNATYFDKVKITKGVELLISKGFVNLQLIDQQLGH